VPLPHTIEITPPLSMLVVAVSVDPLPVPTTISVCTPTLPSLETVIEFTVWVPLVCTV
jgi:hypothetical protein